MFCGNCNYEVPEGVHFCPRCGHALHNAYGGNQSFNNTPGGGQNFNSTPGGGQNFNSTPGGGQNFNSTSGGNQQQKFKEFFTPRNIERYAPVATVLPLALAILNGIIHVLLALTLGLILSFRIDRAADPITIFLSLIFCALALGAFVGLVYVAVKTKNTAYVAVWAAPAAVFSAFISCFCAAFGWSAAAFIFGLIAFVMGLEMIPRITISGHPMDSRMDPGMAAATYKMIFQKLKTERRTASNSAHAGTPHGTGTPSGVWEKPGFTVTSSAESYFDGSGIELWGYIFLTALICLVTCGIATPWMICMIYKWQISHTVINGKRLNFDGTGIALLGNWILWALLTIITCGIYSYFAYVALRKWELSHTFIDGEPIAQSSYFDGNSFEYVGYGLLGGILVSITCGIATPWVVCMVQGWDTKHQVINGRRLTFDGTGGGFLGEYIIIFLLTLITCGIFGPWGIVRMNKYVVKHTRFEA